MKKNYKVFGFLLVIVFVIGAFMLLNKNTSTNKLYERALDGMPLTFNSTKTSSAADSNMFALTAATPVVENEKGEIVNYAAKSIDTSKDGKKITITLKDGLKYENGTEIKAQDYVSAIEILSNPQSKAPYASWPLEWIKGAQEYFDGKSKEITGVKIISDKKYEITLNKPYQFFKSTLAYAVWAPINKEWFNSHGGYKTYGSNYKDLLSSGEYKITKYAKTTYLDFEKNTQSSLVSKKTPKEVRFTFFTELNQAVKDFKNKKLNSIGKNQLTDKLLGYEKAKKENYMVENPTINILANGSGIASNNMKALYLALDKQYIVDNYFYGLGKVRNVMTPSSYSIEKEYTEPNKNEFDLNQAKKIKSADFKNVKFQVSSNATSQLYEAQIKYIIAQWNKIGVNVELIKKPDNNSNGLIQQQNKIREYDVTLGSWGSDYTNPNTYYGSLLGSKTSTAYSYWNNDQIKKYDAIIEKANSEKDEEKANKLYVEADKLQKENGQLYPLFKKNWFNYVQKNGWNVFVNGHILSPTYWKIVN